MANWDTLDKEFYELVDNLSEADWQAWEQNRLQRKAMRRASMELQAKIHMQRMALLNTFSDTITFFRGEVLKTHFSSIVGFTLETNSKKYASTDIGEARFAMAA